MAGGRVIIGWCNKTHEFEKCYTTLPSNNSQFTQKEPLKYVVVLRPLRGNIQYFIYSYTQSSLILKHSPERRANMHTIKYLYSIVPNHSCLSVSVHHVYTQPRSVSYKCLNVVGVTRLVRSLTIVTRDASSSFTWSGSALSTNGVLTITLASPSRLLWGHVHLLLRVLEHCSCVWVEVWRWIELILWWWWGAVHDGRHWGVWGVGRHVDVYGSVWFDMLWGEMCAT